MHVSISSPTPLVGQFLSLPPTTPQSPRSSPERMSDWRSQALADQAAGYIPITPMILIKFFSCDLCTIGIGPRHYEEELFLYPVFPGDELALDTLHEEQEEEEEKEEESTGGDEGGEGEEGEEESPMIVVKEFTLLHICGGCARSKGRHLPDLFRMIQPAYWETTELLCTQDEEIPETIDVHNEMQMVCIRKALNRQVVTYHAWYLFCYCLHQHIPLRGVFLLSGEITDRPLDEQRLPLGKGKGKGKHSGSQNDRRRPHALHVHSPVSPTHLNTDTSLPTPATVGPPAINKSAFTTLFRRAFSPLLASLLPIVIP